MTAEDDPIEVARELLTAALMVTDSDGVPFGEYSLLGELGRGGSGVVYRARRRGETETVALKRLRGGDIATPVEREAFLHGARTAKELEHPRIVRIREIGEAEGSPYFTMDLIEGRNLAEAIDRERPTAAEAAAWLEKVTLAVAHAHHSGVIHRDLKPENILLDAQGEPWVVDFGLAKRVGALGGVTESARAGLGYYMAPEQASGERGRDSVDIFALGVILYELLTGRVPYEGLCFQDWVSELTSLEPVRAPSKFEPRVNRDLELVCLKCLEKDPERRYRSADLLAEDLRRIRDGFRPLHARPQGAAAKALRWLWRRPLQTAIGVGLLLLALVAAFAERSVARATAELERKTLEINAFLANSYAGAMLSQFREFADRVDEAAQQEPLRELLRNNRVVDPSPALAPYVRGFNTIAVYSVDGIELAQWPSPRRDIKVVLGNSYEFRDYLRGASALGRAAVHGVYLSRTYRSESSGIFTFCFAAPVFAADGTWLGNVVAALHAASAIGQVRMQGPAGSGRLVALLGPRDNERDWKDRALSTELFFVVHPRLSPGRELPLTGLERGALGNELGVGAPAGHQFALRWAEPRLIADYRDPLSDPAESLLAAFSPVGQTGYVVVVQTSREAAVGSNRIVAQTLLVNMGLPLAVGFSLLILVARSPARRRRGLGARPAEAK